MAAVSDLMLRRPCINVLTGQQDMASWHQREIVPRTVFAGGVLWCAYLTHILQYKGILGTVAGFCALGFPFPSRGLSRPRAPRGASLNSFPATCVRCQPPPHHID